MAVKKKILSSHEEWLQHRRKFLGGSDMAAVIGCNPWKTNVELWKEKTGLIVPEDISGKPYVKYGTDAEPLLRKLFELDFPEYQMFYEENNSFTNDKYPWGAASLDGWLKDSEGRLGIWECKTTNILQSMQKEKWSGKIPDNYYCQILFYMGMIEADFCILKAQLKSEFGGMPYIQTNHYKIERAEVQEDIDYILEAGEEFWKMVQDGRQPDLLLPEI